MVYQRFKLVPSLSVAENLLLGRETGRLRLNLSGLSARIKDLGQRFNLPVDPAAKIWQLSMGRAAAGGDPAAAFVPGPDPDSGRAHHHPDPHRDQGPFSGALKQLRQDGHSIIFISHKLDEVLALSDRISILNRGRMKATIDRAEADKRSLARLMIASDWEPDAVRLGPGPVRPQPDPGPGAGKGHGPGTSRD